MKPNLLLLSYSKLSFLEASANYTILHFTDGSKKLLSYSLKKYEVELYSTKAFSRIHRRFLVNCNYVISYCDSQVTLFNGTKLPVSRRKTFHPNTE